MAKGGNSIFRGEFKLGRKLWGLLRLPQTPQLFSAAIVKPQLDET